MLSFWKKNTSAKCPVTPEDKEWIDGNLQWLDRNVVALAEQPTVLPTKEFFSRKFTSTEDDAHYVLERVGEICGINVSMIQLDFFHDQIDFGNGLLTTREKHESGVAGSYLGDDEGEAIMIERDQLKDPVSLISVMSHELAHHVLIGLHEIGYSDEKENEYLTDLTAVAYGFGVFQANSAAVSNTNWTGASGTAGWRIGRQGYLPPQVTAYAMAVIQYYKGELNTEPSWIGFMEKKVKKYFLQSVEFLKENPPASDVQLNW